MKVKVKPFELFASERAYFNFEVHKSYQSYYGRVKPNKSWRSCDDF